MRSLVKKRARDCDSNCRLRIRSGFLVNPDGVDEYRTRAGVALDLDFVALDCLTVGSRIFFRLYYVPDMPIVAEFGLSEVKYQLIEPGKKEGRRIWEVLSNYVKSEEFKDVLRRELQPGCKKRK